MLTRNWAWTLGLCFTLGVPDSVATAQAGEVEQGCSLSVQVARVRSAQGRVAIALYNSADKFPDQKVAYRSALVPANPKQVRVVFSGLSAGTYAIAVLHDENQNNRMDFNLVGMPLEGYGFSNDATGFLGAPSFKAAAVKVEGGARRTTINLNYFL